MFQKLDYAMGVELDWDRIDNKKAACICTNIPNLDFNHQDNYPELMNECTTLYPVKMKYTPLKLKGIDFHGVYKKKGKMAIISQIALLLFCL